MTNEETADLRGRIANLEHAVMTLASCISDINSGHPDSEAISNELRSVVDLVATITAAPTKTPTSSPITPVFVDGGGPTTAAGGYPET